MNNEGKYRLLYLYKILQERTDSDHKLSTVQLDKILQDEYGISSHRTTIYEDIKILQELGFPIAKTDSTQNKYYISQRTFAGAELKLLIDAVASSKLITERKSSALIKKLSEQAGPYISKDLKRNICPAERIKARNESILDIIDAINTAINKKQKISFTYFKYDQNKRKFLKNGGAPYIFSPYDLVWNGDYYYVVGWSDKHEGIGCFRVDRIASVPELLEIKAVPAPKRFKAANFIKTNYHMFGGGEVKTVELRCDGSVMDAFIDRFGFDVKTEALGDGTFKATVRTSVNNVFYGWIFGFDGKVEIEGPEDVKERYWGMVERAR